MKKHLLLSCFILLTQLAFSQNSTDLSFVPLVAVDTLYDTAAIAKYQQHPEVKGDNFFVQEWTDTHSTLQKALFFKQGNTYVVYQLPNDGSRFSNFSVSDNKRFITGAKSMANGTGKHYEARGYFYIIDLENRTILSIRRLLVTEISEKHNETIRFGCESSIALKGDIVTISTIVSKNTGYQPYFQADCLPTGAYQITEGKLKKLVLEK